MVFTRSQKRDNDDNNNIEFKIIKRKKIEEIEEIEEIDDDDDDKDYEDYEDNDEKDNDESDDDIYSEDENHANKINNELAKTVETEIKEELECEESESEIENKISDQVKIDLENLEGIFKKSLKKIFKKIKNNEDVNNDIYKNFDDLVYSVYEGEFFERDSIDERKKYIKDKFTKDQIKEMSSELEIIKEDYRNNCPNIIDILKMNVCMDQKKKLLEKLYSFRNSEILTPEYNSTLKFLNSQLSNNDDPDLLILEEKILKKSLNKSDSYRIKILKSKMSFDNKVVAYKKLEIMETYEDTDTSEYAKYKSWLDTLLSVPFGIYNDSGITIDSSIIDIKSYIKNVRDTLDDKLSFLEKPKDQIINLVTQMVRNPDININAIGLHGSKGTGKSQICESIAKAINRPFKMISLGGASDSSSLIGHGFTYVGSGAGSIVNSLIDTRSMDVVILFDELDKVSSTEHGKEIIGTLIHLTDSTTNHKYNSDKYFAGIEFDLSKILFVFTYNDASKIDKILADRLIKINVDNYNDKEKLEITNKHILHYLLDKFKFKENDISFTQEALKHIINESDKTGGLRDIKTKIKIIISRVNNLLLTKAEDNIVKLKYKKLYPHYYSLPVIIPREHVDILLDESITNESKNNEVPFGMYI